MQHPDEGTIHAWLDGALSAEEAAAIEAHAASCVECAAAVAEARGIIAASSRIVTALDDVPSGVVPLRQSRKRPWYVSTQVRAAAALMVVVAGTLLVVDRQDRSAVPMTGRGVTAAISDRATEQVSASPAPPVDTNTPAGPESAPATAGAAPVTGRRRQAAAERDLAASAGALSKIAPVATERPAEPAALSGRVAGTRIDVQKEDERTAVAEKSTADAAQNAAPAAPPATAPQRALMQRLNDLDSARAKQRARFAEGTRLENVVVTGITEATTTLPPLKALRTDTVAATTHTVYEVSPGVSVTLTEMQRAGSPQVGTANRAVGTSSRTAGSAPPSPPAVVSPTTPVAAAAVDAREAAVRPTSKPSTSKPITSITWSNPTTGRSYVLSGSLSKEELEAIRQRLPAQKR